MARILLAAHHALLADTQVLWRALQYAATFGFPVWLRVQDAWLGKGGVAHDGEVATRLGYESEASFSRAFKKVSGVPPGSLRRQNGAPAGAARSLPASGRDRSRRRASRKMRVRRARPAAGRLATPRPRRARAQRKRRETRR